MESREYLFEYHFGGSTWGITIHADSASQAREKIKAVGMATYKGEQMARIGMTQGWWRWPLALVVIAIAAAIVSR